MFVKCSSQCKVPALSTKGEQGGLMCGLGCLFVEPRNHRRQWHFVNVAVLCSFSIATYIAISGVAHHCCALSGLLFWNSQNHWRQWHSVDVALLSSFTTGCCARSQWGLSVQSASPQYKVAALSTKGEQGGLLCGLGCHFVGPRNHRRQWHFVNVALSCSFTSVQSSSSQYK